MIDLDLSAERRAELVDSILEALEAVTVSATVAVRGSLARSCADQFSDIDLLLRVSGDEMNACLLGIPDALQAVQPVRLLRVDPTSAATRDRRLIFVLFRDLPLFWRLDLEVVAEPSPAAPITALTECRWCPAASALMNAVAATKALARGDHAGAEGRLQRGFARIGAALPHDALGDQVVSLASACAERSSDLEDLASETAATAEVLLNSPIERP